MPGDREIVSLGVGQRQRIAANASAHGWQKGDFVAVPQHGIERREFLVPRHYNAGSHLPNPGIVRGVGVEYRAQVRAIGEAASDQIAAGKDPKVEIMVPLVGSVMELHLVRDETERILADVAAEKGVTLTIPIGTMIELPRAALTADEIAQTA